MGKNTSAVKDAFVAAMCAIILSVILLVLFAYKIYWGIILMGIGVVTFLVVLYHHPSRFYRRLVWTCLGLLGTFVAVPSLRIAGIWDEGSKFVVMIDTVGIGGFLGLCVVLIVAIIIAAIMDIRKQNNKADEIIVRKSSTYVKQTKKREQGYRVLETYDSDAPPLIDIWVGRIQELSLINEIQNGVLSITGIGGQGKSALAAKVLEAYRKNNSRCFWDWRDCKEQANRFRTQLISVIEHYSRGKITASTLSDADICWLSKFFFQKIGDCKGLIVFDNVDHYVDVESNQFTSDVSAFVEEGLRVRHNFLIIFTCRPRISYASVRFREVYLRGFELVETRELFNLKLSGGLKPEQESNVQRFHDVTNGHPLWLNIIASQVGRKPDITNVILRSLEAGNIDDRTNSMLRGVWSGLNSNQQTILKYMAEMPRAMTLERIIEFVGDAVTSRNRFDRAFKGLKAISLLIEKGTGGIIPNRFELHPIVKAFVRREYRDQSERNEVIALLLTYCGQLVIRLKGKKGDKWSIDALEQLTTKADLELAMGNISGAIETLRNSSESLIARGIHEEFIRLAKEILNKTNWKESSWIEEEGFGELVRDLIRIMVEIGQSDEARHYLNQYSCIAPSGTARYIALCDLTAYVEWFEKNYEKAIDWGKRGVNLKKTSGLDTQHDSSHTLALAQRDSGLVDDALAHFCFGQNIESIIKEDHFSSKRDASFYGNIGRCLYFKEEIQNAMILYSKSVQLLERSDGSSDILNSGYGTLWIGEALEKLMKFEEAYLFYRKCTSIWGGRAPKRAEEIHVRLTKLESKIPQSTKDFTDEMVDGLCKKWIVDFLSGGKLEQKEKSTLQSDTTLEN